MTSSEFRTYLRSCGGRNPKLNILHAAETLNITPAELSAHICDLYKQYPTMGFEGSMFVFRRDRKMMHYEVCDTKYRRGATIFEDAFWNYSKMNRKVDQHISVFTHDRAWIKEVERNGKVASAQGHVVGVPYLYLELDRKVCPGSTPFEKAKADALSIVSRFPFPDKVTLFTSGNTSIHMQIDAKLFGSPIGPASLVCGRGRAAYNLAHMVAQDVRWNNGIVDVWNSPIQLISESHEKIFGDWHTDSRQRLENIDPNIYGVNSLIRQPFSIHEKSGGVKDFIDGSSVDFSDTPPYLLHWYAKALIPTWRRAPRPTTQHDPDVIIDTLLKHFDFDPDDANSGGWVRDVENPFYDDSSPDVALNLHDGRIHDFGNPDWQISFDQFLSRI
jgi:hypothetical protein